MKRVPLLALVLLALGASGAQASSFSGPEYVALHIAEAYWGGRPPLCRPLVKRSVPESKLAAEARQEGNPLGQGGGITGAATQPRHRVERCELEVLEGMEWPELCITMVHEVGHLWGLNHSRDPASPMYPTAEAWTVPACASAIDPGPAPSISR